MNKAFAPTFILLGFLLTATAAHPSSAEPAVSSNAREPQRLFFQNGDWIQGQLQLLQPEAGLIWQHPDAPDPIQFATANISEIALHSFGTAVPPANCLIHFVNDDEIEGNLVSVTADSLVLETWYGGLLTIPREKIHTITPLQTDLKILYQGPTGTDDWNSWKVISAVADSGEWNYRNGAFLARKAASIARDVQLPDNAIVEFELAWKGFLNLALALYTDSLKPISLGNKEDEPPFGGFYSFQITGFSASILAVNQHEPLRNLGQHALPNLSHKSKAHIQIRTSKPQKSIYLLIDGELVKQWTDHVFAGEGTGIRLVHQGQGDVKFSHLRIQEWDGRFAQNQAAAAPVSSDQAKLVNGDQVLGELQSIQDGKATFSSQGAQLDISLNRILHIRLGGRQIIPAEIQNGSFHASFNRRGKMTFQLQEWNEDHVAGKSPMFGEFKFDPAAFARIQFLPPHQ
jgi:hypothetical protein